MSRSASQIIGAGLTGALIGAAGGAALSSSLPGGGWPLGAAIGAVVLGLLSAWADATRTAGRPQPLAMRIASAAFLMAILGWLLELMLPDWSLWVPGVIIGTIVGVAGLRPRKVLLGIGVGALVGIGFQAWAPAVGWAWVAAATVVVYRLSAAFLWRGRDQIKVMGEQVAPDQLPFVVPFAEAGKHVGVDYLERYAITVGARFRHQPQDIGILASLDHLTGRGFEAAAVDPLIREFYEHTSRFTLSIVPEWKWWMRLPYRLYRETVARPLGQANAPFEIEEVQRGVISWIDTLDVDDDGVADVRAWVRAYQDGQPIYVGIYTVVGIDGANFVAVGFPLPSGSFTATLRPQNDEAGGLSLLSQTVSGPAGHYLSYVDPGGDLTTLRLSSFGEEIRVFLVDGDLKTEQRFSLGGVTFLILHYDIARSSGRAG